MVGRAGAGGWGGFPPSVPPMPPGVVEEKTSREPGAKSTNGSISVPLCERGGIFSWRTNLTYRAAM